MEKKELIRFSGSIYRVLALQGEEVLLIDCMKRNMPKWQGIAGIEGYEECPEADLL